jgi:hypothetical protein
MTGIKYELIACSARITRAIAQKTWASPSGVGEVDIRATAPKQRSAEAMPSDCPRR